MLKNLNIKPNLTLILVLVTSICVEFTPNLSFAQYITTAVAEGMAGTSLAGTEAAAAMLINPASLPHAEPFEGGLFYQDNRLAEGFGRNFYGFSLVDNSDEAAVPGGLGVFKGRRYRPGLENVDELYVHGAVGGFVYPNWSIGLSAIYLGQTPEGQENAMEQWNGVLGALYNPNARVGVAVAYHHFLSADDKIPSDLRLLPQLGLGGHYLFSKYFHLRMDLSYQLENNRDSEFIVATGIESKVGQLMVFRFGARFDPIQDQERYSMGLGFAGPRLKLDYAYSQLKEGEDSALHSVDLRLPFW